MNPRMSRIDKYSWYQLVNSVVTLAGAAYGVKNMNFGFMFMSIALGDFVNGYFMGAKKVLGEAK